MVAIEASNAPSRKKFKVTPVQALADRNFTVAKVAAESGLHIATVRHAVYGGGNNKGTNVQTARLIAKALGYEVWDIEWPVRLTVEGRSPLTGGTYTVGTEGNSLLPINGAWHRNRGDVTKENDLPARARKHTFEEKFCKKHYLLLPISGHCDDCVV